MDGGSITVDYSESVDGDMAFSFGSGDCLVIKLDDLGSVQWKKTFGGTSVDNGQSIQQAIERGYIVSGFSESTN